MNVWIVTKEIGGEYNSDHTIVGVFSAEELVYEYMDWLCENTESFSSEKYDYEQWKVAEK